jgi:hypothetical protein
MRYVTVSTSDFGKPEQPIGEAVRLRLSQEDNPHVIAVIPRELRPRHPSLSVAHYEVVAVDLLLA